VDRLACAFVDVDAVGGGRHQIALSASS
jgi:hypothetical protein